MPLPKQFLTVSALLSAAVGTLQRLKDHMGRGAQVSTFIARDTQVRTYIVLIKHSVTHSIRLRKM